ncbi:hypothetical protein NMYAN_30011 [Nitrosomonas nitrosa]|uniref:Uncharacterized protein n=1 Tax=Nitrosomonas nitrosa TaxID=52442 RepID=A0A8H8Z2L2_9PROT|nr:hypothetical protein NMYAN_30011 [Nitrosomonas nitrosa]
MDCELEQINVALLWSINLYKLMK